MLSTFLATVSLSAVTCLAATSSAQSHISLISVLRSIRQYSTSGTWNDNDYSNVQTTLQAQIADAPQIPSTPTTAATTACTISNPYNAATIANVVKTCTNIAVNNVTVPGGQTLKLNPTLANTIITFQGHTSWLYYNASYDLLAFSGVNLTVQGAAGHVIDGNGSQWWDGQGSNGGIPKPNHMITVSKNTGYSLFKNLYIKNAPTHVFYISGSDHMYAVGNVIDMLDGKTILPNGLPAAHNTDGWDVSTTTNSFYSNNVVFNQDDCVALTSGVNVVFNNYYCEGGHGMSIGSVGGKSNNTVQGITFSNSQIINSENGARIKGNSGTTGSINAVTYQNIYMSGISTYGIDVQQDYLNGGPTGTPTAGVNITNIAMLNVTGSVTSSARDYHILVATPQTDASTWTFTNVAISGGMGGSCNSVPPGFNCS